MRVLWQRYGVCACVYVRVLLALRFTWKAKKQHEVCDTHAHTHTHTHTHIHTYTYTQRSTNVSQRILHHFLQIETNGAIDAMCLTKECLTTTSYMMGMMDRTSKPCADFYQYTCGGWLSTNTIPATRSVWSIDSVIIRERDQKLRNILESPVEEEEDVDSGERKAKTLYQKCMDLDGIEHDDIQPLMTVIESMGGPALSGNFVFFLSPRSLSVDRKLYAVALGVVRFAFLNVLTLWMGAGSGTSLVPVQDPPPSRQVPPTTGLSRGGVVWHDPLRTGEVWGHGATWSGVRESHGLGSGSHVVRGHRATWSGVREPRGQGSQSHVVWGHGATWSGVRESHGLGSGSHMVWGHGATWSGVMEPRGLGSGSHVVWGQGATCLDRSSLACCSCSSHKKKVIAAVS